MCHSMGRRGRLQRWIGLIRACEGNLGTSRIPRRHNSSKRGLSESTTGNIDHGYVCKDSQPLPGNHISARAPAFLLNKAGCQGARVGLVEIVCVNLQSTWAGSCYFETRSSSGRTRSLTATGERVNIGGDFPGSPS